MGQMWLTNVFLFCGVILICKLKTFHAKCGGKTEIKDVLNGNITLGLGANTYPTNTHCEWLIRAPLPGQHIQLTFKEFDTECSFDYLKIFDGSSTSANLLGSFSGDTLPPVIVSNSSTILINFFSDNNYVRIGWRIDFTISNCSGNCSGHGNCVGNTCNCDDLYTGDACDVYLCPQMCNNITDHGKCSKLIGKCTCNPGYIGQSCSFSLHNQSDIGVWHLIKQRSSVFHARFGHAGVYVEQNSALWIFGGSNLNVFFDDLVKFDFVKNEWFLVNSSVPSPVARFRHTLVLYKDTLILFGGEITNGTLVNDLWSFNMSSIKWKLLRGNGIGSPPGLASHTANVVGDKLFVFGGRSKEHGFSYDIYTYDLSLTGGWEKVIYKLGKNSDLRLVGHSSIYYPPLKSLVIFGGFRQVSSRIHKKVNDIYLYHVEHKVWMEITDVHAASSIYVPPPMAYHSSVFVGDYMLVYGGNVHTHSFDETCFGNNIYLFNLNFFTWISPLLLTVLGLPTNSSWQPKRGRFSFVASVFKGNTILVAGGFNGNANGDLLAYKLPSNIVSSNLTISTTSGIHCQLYKEKECGLDPFCVWCNSNLNCLSIHKKDSCSVMISSYTAHMCHAFVQCASCLTWGSQLGLLCGWCVQDSRCYPRGSPSGACSPHTNIRGWWGNGGTFLTVVNQCRTKDYPPGLTIKVFYYKWDDTPKLDLILLMNPLRATFDGSMSSHFVRVQMIGFIYPFLSLPINRNVEIKIRISKTDASLHLSTDVDPSNTEKVISMKNDRDGVLLLSKMASRKNITHPLFPNPMENKMYYMEVKTQLPQNVKDVKLWVYMDGKLLNGSYVRPFFSNNCSGYISCLECLSDASCGWCSTSNTCVHRNSSTTCSHASGEVVYLILNATFCETCNQYMDCDSCNSSGSDCVWLLAQYCDRVGSTSETETCKQPCYSYNDCDNCVLNRQCLWCGNRQKCLPWFSYRPDHLHGQCSHWSDRNTVNGQCPDCSSQNKCEDCIKERYCGWCGEYHNGRCFDGEFDGPYNGQCEQLMFSNNTDTNSNSSLWSYTKCPDENECITKKYCHSNATCTNRDPGYKCECRIGFEGNGYHCNVSCNPPCVYGKCNSLLTCDCDLGWSGNVCSIDCGCNNHSTCHKNIGVCDRCQEFTYGKHCVFCLPGSYGNATTNLGCRKCECNGHVDERRGICDGKTGQCFCLNNTMGKHCNECLPGFVGQPQKGGGCYYPCEAHSFLWNITHGALSTTVGSGTTDIENTNCVWIITTLRNQSEHIVFSNEHATGTITFRIKDLHVDCQTDHVYIYEGLPPYNLTNFALTSNSSFNQIASLCGFDASSVPTIETRTGTLVIVFKGNIGNNSFTNGFNATFVINHCPNSCTGNRYCFSNGLQDKCVCKTGWTGPGCDQVICLANCSEELGHGYCDKVYGTCVCKEGFAGESCSIQNPFGNFTWELIDNISGRDSTLPRMGHTMIADERTQSLLIYGGYSFRHGILGNIWIYNITKRNVIPIPDDNEGPSPRYLHAATVYKRQMYISGGITQQDFSSELWKFDLDSKKWTKLQNLLRRVAGHTVNVVNGTMYLIGGYARHEYCSTKVYILELDLNSSWNELNPSGDTSNVCFGHTTVYDQQLESLIVFGKEADRITATLAVLQLTTNKWTVVPVQLQSYSRYFHLSMIVGDVMIVTGGYTGGSVQEFADITLVYNLRCGQWEKLDLKGIFPLALAHSSIASINGQIYVFGGYNGIALEELFRLNISSDWCSMFSTKSKCISIGGCNWCFDKTLNRSFCYTPDDSASQACSNNTVPGNQCNANTIAMPLSSALTSSFDLCSQYSICSSCIQAKGYKSASCFWAINPGQCLSVYFQPIMCVFGICSRVLREYDACPGQCQRASYCYDCLKQYNCAWCADPLENGNGTCMEGTFQGPLNGTCQKKNKNVESTSLVWVSSVCLLEDECRNNHHKCNENETCLNLEYKYKCPCKAGYTGKSRKCVPVCTQGCGNGDCIYPDVCFCWFGWVGSNCTTACHCYGQGNCVDENQLNNCTNCRNHTAGVSCERCVRGFVGQNGVCLPCFDRCNHNAEQCYSVDDYNIITGSYSTKELSLLGPRSDNDFICQCRDNSTGVHCETCHAGYFKLKKERKCERCRCRGHASTCTSNTGLDCNCKNNTKVPPYCMPLSPSSINCYKDQCSFCEMNYFGNPSIAGQQCYLTMRILQRSSLAREKSGNSRLFSEQTNFFYVYPSYTNSDIRLTFDVFDGSIDVYIATVENAFKVRTDQNISISQKVSHSELYSDGLNTYTTFSGHSTVAVITAINRKLVVTFPFEEHQLEDKKFYIVTKAGHSGAYGIVYFKQDNSKIDLVVFFAVFFSCFFLLLSVIVIGWSIKHHIHSRQEVHDREVQSVRLQNRPFAKFSFLFEYHPPSRNIIRHRKTTGSTRKAIQALGVQSTNDNHAAVSTIMFQMPQTEKTKMSLVLGTTLTIVSPQQHNKLSQTSPKMSSTMETENL